MFVQLGMTDDSYTIPDSENLSYREYVNLFLPYSPTDSVELKLRHSLKIDQDDLMWDKLLELDIFNKQKKIGIPNATPAMALQEILMHKWSLEEDDKDMILMYHKIGYDLGGKQYQIDSSMVAMGDDQTYTAMAKTVGLPVAIAAIKILNEEITTYGVQRPLSKEVYEPILKELESFGITFKEKETPYLGYNPDNVTA
jgi:saccharopine dehydrogenase (NAD+, L-glutamate forming)